MKHETLATILFLVFVAGTLAITFWASRNTKTATDYYAGGRSFSGVQNGLAIGGDYMSAASFLGIAGIIALSGYDGFLYSIGFLVAWLVALLLVAELMRNSGKFTMADVLAFRMSPRPVRTAAGVSTIVVSIFYLLAQMVGAGALVGLLLGITSDSGKVWTIIAVGLLMVVYVVIGGMKGTTWVQIVKAVMLMTGAALVTLLVLGKFGFNLSSLLGDAATQSGKGDAFLNAGLKYGTEAQGIWGKIDLISLGLALVLGTAGLPHILIRFYTVPTAKDARKSVMWGIGIIGVFYLLTLVLGFGAAAVVGSEKIAAANAAGNTAAPQLAEAIGADIFGEVGGTILLAVIAAVAFATILAVVAGLTLASSSSFAHDLYAHVFKRGEVTDKEEVRVARIAAFVIGAIAIALAIPAQSLNVAFLVALAFAVAASGNLPAILYSLFWKRFNTAGAVSAIYGGLISALVLVIFSPAVSGAKTAMFPDVDFHLIELSNPGIFSIPIGFLCGYLGTIFSKEYNASKYAEIEVRSLTGVGMEKASEH
ncbi:cation acetate symporter [Planotetraspora phitsanulokensis]|uniref:Cation acetate symporter n=1 Tax=Planotetraspora phitsanulokensis TaxID=575192 RepID=A0A8J3XGH7_9ACTN|nr:cation acetate symporter [Planotetraspora phitsanulokensis]GII40837.1 cation acetate symporter [Planotetraspora phitsanulokensis]